MFTQVFDTHSHYTDTAFDSDRDAVLQRLPEQGIVHAVLAGTTVEDSAQGIRLAEQYEYLYAAVGIHPETAGAQPADYLAQLKQMAKHPKAVAIGEIGLDYYWHKEESEHQRQQEMFRAQMDIAREEKLPFMIHSRDAAEDTLNIVRDYMKKDMSGGIIHCFSYSKEIAA